MHIWRRIAGELETAQSHAVTAIWQEKKPPQQICRACRTGRSGDNGAPCSDLLRWGTQGNPSIKETRIALVLIARICREILVSSLVLSFLSFQRPRSPPAGVADSPASIFDGWLQHVVSEPRGEVYGGSSGPSRERVNRGRDPKLRR